MTRKVPYRKMKIYGTENKVMVKRLKKEIMHKYGY